MKKKNLLLIILLIVDLFVLGVFIKYSGTPTGESGIEIEQMYIGNIKTKKFHYPGCDGAERMDDANKVYLNCTREEAISTGYSPCSNCEP